MAIQLNYMRLKFVLFVEDMSSAIHTQEIEISLENLPW